MKLGIINYDYYTNSKGPVLRLICRDKNKKRYIIDIQDEKLTPRFYILAEDYDVFMETISEKGLISKVLDISPSPLKSVLDEPLYRVYAKYPFDISVLRDAVNILTLQADVKWEKMAIQQMKLRQFIEIEKYKPYHIYKCSDIKHTNDKFFVDLNICYWDIETRSGLKYGWADYRNAADIVIISYVVYNKFKNEYIYYAWKEEFEPKTIIKQWDSELMPNIEVPRNIDTNKVPCVRVIHDVGKQIIMTRDIDETMAYLPKDIEYKIKDVLSTSRFKKYPKKSKLIIKLFNNEIDMHKSFINDFVDAQYDGIMTFNGRGGYRKIRSVRKWFNGFDMPVFYERCKKLGLERQVIMMSPFPLKESSNGRFFDPPVKIRSNFDEHGNETKHEVYIKGVSQFDLYFDSELLQYTKNEYEMTRRNLDTFLQYFVGIGKVEHEGSVGELFDKDWEEEMYYNIVDVEGMLALDYYFNYIHDMTGRALIFCGKIEDALSASKLHDHINLWFTSNRFIMDTKYYDNRIRDMYRPNRWNGFLEKKVGGYNKEVIKGIHGIGFIIDFSKLYPNCNISCNVGVDTKIDAKELYMKNGIVYVLDTHGKSWKYDDLARTPAGLWRKDKISINSIIFKEFISDRNKIAAASDDYLELYSKTDNPEHENMYHLLYNQQFSYKTLINGKIGADGNEGQRTFDRVVYNSAPAMGQELIKFVIDWLSERGYQTLLASTDSALTLAKSNDVDGAWDESQRIVSEINIALDEYIKNRYNPIEQAVKIGVEKIFDRVVIFDKRRYIMNTVIVEGKHGKIKLKEPKIYVRALEIVRGDSAFIAKKIQLDMIKIMMTGNKDDAIKYIKKLDKEFDSYSWGYICSRASISDNVDAGNEHNARYNACRNANRIFNKGYDAGARPLLGYFVKHPRQFKGELIPSGEFIMAFDEKDEPLLKRYGFDLNYQKIKQANVIKKIEPFLKMIDKNLTYESCIRKRLDSWM